jgi:hypothetical protein
MRKPNVLPVFALLASLTLPAAPQEKPKEIRAMGCVQPGVETRCLEVTDIRTGALFNLFFKGVQPAMGSGIEFVGVPHEGVTTCMQGTAVDVKTWVRRNLKCVQGTAPKPKQ